MKKSAIKKLVALCIGLILMFVWIFITVILTGEREMEDFSKQDWFIFFGFLLVETITTIITFIIAVKMGKENRKRQNTIESEQASAHGMNRHSTPREKKERRRGLFMLSASWILSLTFITAGIIFQNHTAGAYSITLKVLLTSGCLVPALLFPLNILMKKKYISKWNHMQVSELQQYFISHRNEASEASVQKVKALKILRLISDIYAAFFCLSAMVISWCAGALAETSVLVPLCFYAGVLFLASISRIRFPVGKTYFQEDETYVEPGEYPELYRLAGQAQKALNCNGKIKISLLAECTAGIAKVGDTYSVCLGVIYLSILSEDELYSILLHEFSHMISDNSNSNKQASYNYWICSGGNPHFLSGLTSILFCYLDTVYNFQYTLYSYSVSVIKEEEADRAMAEHGNKIIAASSLIKLKYYELFEWENEAADRVSLYEAEQPMQDIVQQRINAFMEKIPECSEKWNRLAEAEILSRTASHPTLKMRLDALGVHDYQISDASVNIDYMNDVRKSVLYVDGLICKKMKDSYEFDRLNRYTKPKEKIDCWESNGKPICATDYYDIDASLRQLGRMSESKSLCDSAIAALPESASYYAKYIKGTYLLHCFDASGLALIYEAMDYNSNYIDDGLEQIGQFCCLTGRQAELEQYRKKAIELAQKQKDDYSQISVLKKGDNLSSEHLPQDLQNGIAAYIGSIDNGIVQKVYIVRKNISENFFASAVVICFEEDADEDAKTNFFHKMFSYLDTCGNWQFSLFDYSAVKKIKFDKIPDSCIYHK